MNFNHKKYARLRHIYLKAVIKKMGSWTSTVVFGTAGIPPIARLAFHFYKIGWPVFWIVFHTDCENIFFINPRHRLPVLSVLWFFFAMACWSVHCKVVWFLVLMKFSNVQLYGAVPIEYIIQNSLKNYADIRKIYR